MDSITQFALGASVALATVNRRDAPRRAVWKIALIGGMVGTLPDLDAFIDFGDAISNMIRHRAETHGLFYLTLFSPLIAWLVSKLHGGAPLFRRWLLAVWLILLTHVFIDWLTIYGTQLAQPFSDVPYGVGSLFVIDPLYTLPLLIGIIITVSKAGSSAVRWNAFGLAASTVYIVWSLGVHQHVSQLAAKHPPVSDESLNILLTAAPLNTVLWRAVAVTPTHYYEGWYSLFDPEPRFSWKAYPRNAQLIEEYKNDVDVSRIARFSHGFFKLEKADQTLFVTDLRLGLEPFYSFRFDLGNPDATQRRVSERVGVRPDLANGLPWLWQRIKGNPDTIGDYIAKQRP